MKRLISIAFAVIATLFSAPASPKERAIVVAAPPTRAQWVTKIGRNLDSAIWYPSSLVYGQEITSGIVTVSFTIGNEGKAFAPRLTRSSRQRQFNISALDAIAHLKPMLPLPLDVTTHHRIIAHIIFAATQSDFDKQLRQLRAESALAANAIDERDTVVLNSLPHSTIGALGSSR